MSHSMEVSAKADWVLWATSKPSSFSASVRRLAKNTLLSMSSSLGALAPVAGLLIILGLRPRNRDPRSGKFFHIQDFHYFAAHIEQSSDVLRQPRSAREQAASGQLAFAAHGDGRPFGMIGKISRDDEIKLPGRSILAHQYLRGVEDRNHTATSHQNAGQQWRGMRENLQMIGLSKFGDYVGRQGEALSSNWKEDEF